VQGQPLEASKRGRGWQAFWRDESGRQKSKGGFSSPEEAAGYRQRQLDAVTATRDA
jgi:hypothetical protein